MEIIRSNISIRQIFLSRQAWLHFWAKYVFLLRWAIIWNVARMLLCRHGLGHQVFSCPTCHTLKFIPHTCKSRFCSSCGKAAGDRWVEKSLSDMLDVPYKHLFFTLPEEFRIWFKYNRKIMLDSLFLVVKDTLLDYAKQRGYKPGQIIVLHTFGADLKWNPHVHVISTAGGLSIDGSRWIENTYFPWNIIRPMYQYAFLKQFKKLFKEEQLKIPKPYKHIRDYAAFNSWLSQFYNKDWFVQLGKSLEEKRATVRYVGRYTKRPVIAEYRIKHFDGRSVTFSYKDRATGMDSTLSLPVEDFIKALVQHIPDMHYRTVRHSGIFATRVRTKALQSARKLLNQAPKPKPAPLYYRELYQKTFNADPIACPKCGSIMILTYVLFVYTCDIRARVNAKHEKLKRSHPRYQTGYT